MSEGPVAASLRHRADRAERAVAAETSRYQVFVEACSSGSFRGGRAVAVESAKLLVAPGDAVRAGQSRLQRSSALKAGDDLRPNWKYRGPRPSLVTASDDAPMLTTGERKG